jgi:hypothetical protein
VVSFFSWEYCVPVTYQIDTTTRRIHTICSRPLKFAEVVDHFRALKEDPTCKGQLDVLLDVSDADPLPESRQLAAIGTELDAVRAKVEFGLCAIVATRDAMLGMMRMFEVPAGPYFRATRVFRSAVEAEAWLASRPSTGDPA